MSKKSSDGVSIFSRAVRDVAEQEEAVEAAMESARTSGEAEAAKAGEKEEEEKEKMKEIDTNFLPKEELKVRFFLRKNSRNLYIFSQINLKEKENYG